MFKIRTLQLSDFERLKIEIKDPSPDFLQVSSPQKFLYTIQSIIPHTLRTSPSIHLAVDGKSFLGFIALCSISKPNNCWQIQKVYVPDEIRNKGIGEELLRYVISVYGGYGIEHFLAEINSDNFPALSLFHQCGFRRYAKVYFYEKEFETETLNFTLLDRDFTFRPQNKNDLPEIEKLELAIIPPDLRPALGRSRDYFRDKKNVIVLVDQTRNLVIGWAQIQEMRIDDYFIELLINPGWSHLYEQFLSTIICDYLAPKSKKLKLTIKAVDYVTELAEILTKSGFVAVTVKELLVRTIWQKVKERKKKMAKLGAPSIAPT